MVFEANRNKTNIKIELIQYLSCQSNQIKQMTLRGNNTTL